MRSHACLLLLLVTLAASQLLAADRLHWSADLDATLKEAAAGEKPVLVLIRHP